ncbi:MAG: prephenate dehydrogenase [Candidatus Omnitrophota bacterium]
MNFRRIAIVGLGMMGGSLAAACRKRFPQAAILGVSRDPQALRTAVRKRWISAGTRDLRVGISHADLVVLCTPVDVLPEYLRKLDRWARPGTLVTDLGSVKSPLLKQIRKKKWKRIRFVSAHPMVGSHIRGLEAASSGIFEKGYCFLIREKGCDPRAFRAVRGFWKKIAGEVRETSVLRHDRLTAEISHLPHLTAVALMRAVDQRSLPFGASGFRDTTRVAQGHPSIWAPILLGNRRALLALLRALGSELRRLGGVLRAGDRRRLERILRETAGRRGQI